MFAFGGSALMGRLAPLAVHALPEWVCCRTRAGSAVAHAAELYRKAIAEGLEEKPETMAKARQVLRELLGNILLQPAEDGSLWAHYEMHLVGVKRFAMYLRSKCASA